MKINTTTQIFFYFLMVLAMLSWGASWVSAKVLSDYITAQELIFYRYFITTFTLLPVLYYLRRSLKIDKRSLFISIVSSIFLVLYSIYFFDGTKYGTAGLGGAFVTTLTPILTFILLVLFFKKEFFRKDFFAVVLGALGVLLILNIWNFSLDEIFVLANLYFIIASFSWSALTISNSRARIDPLVLTFYIYTFTTIIGYFITPFESGNIFEFNYIFWINFVIISIISTTFATSIYFIAIKKIGTNEASAFIFLVPFFAVLLSYIFLDEQIYLSTFIGIVLTVVAVIIINNIKLPFFKRKKN